MLERSGDHASIKADHIRQYCESRQFTFFVSFFFLADRLHRVKSAWVEKEKKSDCVCLCVCVCVCVC